MTALNLIDYEEGVRELFRLLRDTTSAVQALKSDLEAALKREDVLVSWLERFHDIAKPVESMAHLDEIEAMNVLLEEIEQALEPYKAKEQAQ